MADIHRAARIEGIGSYAGDGFAVVVTHSQNSKTDETYGLHIRPGSFDISGQLQLPDFLTWLGFRRSPCAFHNGDCFSRTIDSTFDAQAFCPSLARAFGRARQADSFLSGCGIYLPHPEGSAFFFGQRSNGDVRQRVTFAGDGHTAEHHEDRGRSEDQYFLFSRTFVTAGRDKGWVTHYRPRHKPLSPEMQSAFAYLGLHRFDNCPQFDFEQCHWRFDALDGDSWQRNSFIAAQFDAHPTAFSQGLEMLLSADVETSAFGLGFLDRQVSSVHVQVPSTTHHLLSSPPIALGSSIIDMTFDVAVSFAGPQRPLAERASTIVRDAGFEVFYDDFYPEQLWGKDLYVLFDEIYRKRSRFCLMFVSAEYRDRMWTNHERQSAQARALEAKGDEYILPILVDPDVELPGLRPQIGYVSLSAHSVDEIAQMLVTKLRSSRA